jgi:hypothetical protein
VFTNIDKITRYRLGHVKPELDQVDPHARVYDIGEDSDVRSVTALIRGNVAERVATFRDLPTAEAASRRRSSMSAARPRPAGLNPHPVLMPENDSRPARHLGKPVAGRIANIDDFADAVSRYTSTSLPS